MARLILEKQPKFFKARFLAPFSRKYRFYHELGKFPHHLQLIAIDVLLTDDRRIALVKNSKAGCTTAAHVLYQYSRGTTYEGDIHQPKVGLLQGRAHFTTVLPRLDHPDTLNVTFVRHPVRRAASAFTDFFLDRKNPRTRFHIDKMRELGFRDDASPTENFDAFLRFLDLSLSTSRDYTDRHFRPQTVNTAIDHIRYDVLGRVENFEADMTCLLEMAGTPPERIAQITMRPRNPSRSTRYEPTRAQTSRLEQLYAEDFERFGY